MKSIYGKLIIGFLVSIFISFSFAGYFVLRNNSQELSEVTKEELLDTNALLVSQINNQSIDEVNLILSHVSKALELSIYLTNGSTQYTYGDFKSPTGLQEDIQILLSNDRDEVNLRNSFFQTVGMNCHFDNDQYALFIQKNISAQENIIKHSVLMAVGFIFIVGSIVFLIIADIIVKPITRLTRATQELAKGNYNVSVNYRGNDEIGRLNQSFNLMAKELVKQEQIRQQFISDVSHEFQTPLTSINGFATILKNEDLTNEQREKYTDIILFESKRLSTLSKNMLQLTLLDGEDTKLNIENYSLTKQLNRVMDSLEAQAIQKDIEIESNLPKKEIFISGDQNRLEQVWINILNNAIKYTDEGGYISVNLKKNSKDVEIMISDTGIGMDEEAQRHIFERFYREDKARSVGGNGLGLSIVKSIVDLHGGSIQVKSQKDVGSEFYITLPYDRNNAIKDVLKSYRKENNNELK